jgi:hypothetical protein
VQIPLNIADFWYLGEAVCVQQLPARHTLELLEKVQKYVLRQPFLS